MSEARTYPLTPMQEGMLFHSLSAPGTGVEIEQILCTSSEPFDLGTLSEAWRRVRTRHEALRTRFVWEGIQAPVQEVLPNPPFAIEVTSAPGSDDEWLAADRRRDFDLTASPMRLAVAQAPGAWRMLWSFHHAILDGRSFPIVLREVFDAYTALRHGADWRPDGALQPFEEFARHVARRDHEGSRAFWEQRLGGFRPPDYPLATRQARGNSGDFGAVERRLDPDLAETVRRWADASGLSLNLALQAAWVITATNHTRSPDVVFGATRACRHTPVAGVERMVGLLINTVPVRASGGGRAVEHLLQHLRTEWTALRDHELTPLTAIQQWGRVPGSLFDSIVVFDTAELDATLRASGGEWDRRQFVYRGRTGYPITLIGYGGPAPLFRLEYDRQVIADAHATALLDQTLRAFTALPSAARTPAGMVPVLAPAAREALMALATPRRTGTPDAASLADRVFAGARERPDRVAVRGAGGDLTYADLLDRSARIASGLAARGVGPEARVGIMMDRTPGAVAAMLGVMRAGAAYVPLELDTPLERVRLLARDAGLRVLVRDPMAPPIDGLESVGVDQLLAVPIGELPRSQPDQPAYVMYTSGSTGQPKGVVVTHANVLRLFDACAELFAFTHHDVWSCFHSFAFDFSVWEMWCALLSGATTVIAGRDQIRSPADFATLVAREGVTVLSQTPSAFRELQERLLARAGDLALRYVVFGGEALNPTTLGRWFQVMGSRAALVNMYGITETTVHVSFRPITPADTARPASVIGRPLPDLGILLLTPEGNLAPPGAPAEMFVAGDGVSRGYLGRPEQTRERFVETPWLPGRRVYRTGDLARLLPDGDLEFLGRADHQVKVRGHRIEPGEVEHALRRHPRVREARVVARPGATSGAAELAAYLIVEGACPSVSELRAHLEGTLPRYMIPAWFVPVDRIPLTPNGKLDVGALPDPEPLRPDLGVAFVAPAGPVEETIAAVWREALGVSAVGSRDNFFDLGGNSLLLVRVAGLLQDRLGREVSVVQLFEHPTVGALAGYLSANGDEAAAEYDDIARRAARQRRTFLNQRKS